MKVIGVREVNYTSKTTNKLVHGYDIHGTYPRQGLVCGSELTDKQYISDGVVERSGGFLPPAGAEIIFYYNRYGKVDRFEIT